MALQQLLAGRRPGTPPDHRGRTTALLVATSLAVVACGTTAQDLDGAPDADAVDRAAVVFDGDELPVAAVTCSEGPEVTAALEDGGDLQVAGEDDGTLTVRIVLADEGASVAWEAEDPGAEAVTLGPDGAEGTVTTTPVDLDGTPDADREDAELTFDLPCGA